MSIRTLSPPLVYRGPEVCRVARISYKQLDYWDRIGLVVPSVALATGSGSQRLYSADDVVVIRAIADLLAAGYAFQHIRQNMAPALREAIKSGQSEYRVTTAVDLGRLAGATDRAGSGLG